MNRRLLLLARPGMSGANVSPIGRNKKEWFVQLPIIGGWNKPLFIVSPYRAHIRSAHARLRPLRRLRVFFLMGAATPPLPSFAKEGSSIRMLRDILACRGQEFCTSSL